MASDYPKSLVEQATALLSLDARGKPRQANLRRAVSSAYYAVFHRLCIDATAEVVGVARSKQEVGRFLARKFDHGRMKTVCGDFAAGSRPRLPQVLQSAPGASPTNATLQQICLSFVALQEARHSADYDLARQFKRAEAAGLVRQAELALADWAVVRTTDQARLFKLCLLVGTSARG